MLDNTDMTKLSFESETQSLYFEFEKTFVMDGIPYASEQLYDGTPYQWNALQSDMDLLAHVGIGLCHTYFGQWSHAIYDPQLSALFTVPPSDSPAPSNNNNSSKQNNIVRIVAPVVVVAVVLIIAALILAVRFSPSLQERFLPSRLGTTTKRQPREDSFRATPKQTMIEEEPISPSPSSPPSGWRPSTKPPTM